MLKTNIIDRPSVDSILNTKYDNAFNLSVNRKFSLQQHIKFFVKLTYVVAPNLVYMAFKIEIQRQGSFPGPLDLRAKLEPKFRNKIAKDTKKVGYL